MLELLQRHTLAGTENYKKITHMVESAHEMLNVAVNVAKSYVGGAAVTITSSY